ncbi:hypothetical protein N7468_008419 [Penicillium chermesinum]|uniref:Glutaminase n=1 Tax=Penicillium chermesinum TaxID=63820 RepID=A0A9W9TIA5_9EURO|nr:uncharacterized protein N7468_008419 [Penicillium chermesinum]KAJ5223877.1 hypothetical protein N7468_008419 [Penicillium chermesinum]
MRFLHNSLGLSSLCSHFLSFLCTSTSKPYQVIHHPALPPSYPLAVRNPYLSAWMPSNRVQQLPYADSQFWAGQELGWAVIVRVEGQAYSLMGVSDLNSSDILPAEVRRAEFTATHSLFDLKAGGIAIRLDFFSPVSPSNYLRQSLPFSYLTVTVTECWGEEVQIYSDIDGRWTGRGNEIMHEFEEYDGLVFHELSVQDAVTYAEEDDMALWGKAILASRPNDFSTVSASAGHQKTVRNRFAEVGALSGPVASVTFAVGYERKEAINYLGDAYTGYYRARYPTTHEALSFFLDDYGEALSESVDFDNEMTSFSTAAAGQKYADILALSTRQAYGGIDLTIPGDSLDTDNVLAFIKELSSDGNANTIDVIMPAFPVYWVLDPNWIRLLLEPLMQYLAADRWTLPYAIHDIGSHYPNATGHDDQKAEPMPIEESGNLLILALAYVQATGDRHWATEYLHIFQKYADYLVENGIDIANQLSSNDAAGPLPNETNLAIKAAIGIKAFGVLSDLDEYSNIADDHGELFFNQGLGTDDAHKMSNDFFSSVRGEYGVPLDHRQDWAKSDWNMWLAATFDPATRDEFIDDLWAFMTNGKHTWPFSDRYVASSAYGNEPGIPILCRARPTVGGHFALLALKGPASFQAFSSNVSQSDQTLRSKGVEL